MSRVRTRQVDAQKRLKWKGIDTSFYGGSPPSSASAVTYYDKKSSITDEVSPRFSSRPFNPCSHTRIEASPIIPGSWRAYWGDEFKGLFEIETMFVGPGQDTFQVPEVEIPWNDLVRGLASQIKGLLQTKSLIGVTLKELPATVRMVKNPFGLLRGDWRRLAGRSPAAKLAKLGANLWLEGQYGWSAGYYDLQNLAGSLAKVYDSTARLTDQGEALQRFTEREFVVGSKPDPTMSDASWAYYKDNGEWSTAQGGMYRLLPQGPWVTTAVLSCKRMGRDIPVYSLGSRIAQAFGATSRDILSSLWEATPYSFVVDWVVDFDSVLGLLDRRYLLSEGVESLGYSMKSSLEFKGEYTPGTPWEDVYEISRIEVPSVFQGTSGFVTSYQRTAGLPTSEGVLISEGLSALQLANLASLVLQRLA